MRSLAADLPGEVDVASNRTRSKTRAAVKRPPRRRGRAKTKLGLTALLASLSLAAPARAFDEPVDAVAKPFEQCADRLIGAGLARSDWGQHVASVIFDYCSQKYGSPVYWMMQLELGETRWTAEIDTKRSLIIRFMSALMRHGADSHLAPPLASAEPPPAPPSRCDITGDYFVWKACSAAETKADICARYGTWMGQPCG